MKPDADSPEDIRLNNLLARAAHARRVALAPGFSQRVLDSLPEQATAEREQTSANSGRSRMWTISFKIAASIAVAGMLWCANRPVQTASTEESWMREFASEEFTASDLALIAQLHEVLEAEISTEYNAAWTEPGTR